MGVLSGWGNAALAASVVFLVLLTIAVLCGNVIVIIVHIRSFNKLHSPASACFTINLAVADLSVGLCIIPFVIDLLSHHGHWRFGETWRHIVAFANFFFCIASIMTLMLLSFDLYLAVVYPLRYLGWMDATRAKWLCLAAWVYSLLCGLPPLLGVSSYFCFIPALASCSDEAWRSKESSAFAILVVTFSYGLASIFIIYFYIRIYQAASLQGKRIDVNHARFIEQGLSMQKSNPTVVSKITRQPHDVSAVSPAILIRQQQAPQRREEKQGNAKEMAAKFFMRKANTLLLVTVLYFICWSPYCLILFYEIGQRKKINAAVTLICLWFGYINSCCNPVIYSLRYAYFRRELKSLWALLIRVVRRSKDATSTVKCQFQIDGPSIITAKVFQKGTRESDV